MRLILHLLEYNLKFHKIRLFFMCLISMGILFGCYYFIPDLKERGTSIIQYSMYMMFLIFTMRMNSKSNLSLGVKHLLALPMTNREIVLAQSIADITFYFPISFVIMYGVYLVKPEYHIVLVTIIFHIGLVAANIISFNKKIDLGRMQHTKASFKNSFVYVKKYLDTIIQIAIMSLLVLVLAISFESNIFLQEYAFLILVVIFTFVVFSRTVKMLKDETLSYFLLKRDVKTVFMKLALIGVPFLAISLLSKNSEKDLMRSIAGSSKEMKFVDHLSSKVLDFSSKVDDQKLLIDMIEDNEKGIDVYFETHGKFPLDVDVMGSYLPHLAARLGKVNMLKRLHKQDPKMVNLPGKYKKTTPLQTAMQSCQLASAEFLIKNGANINQQRLNGDSAIIIAAKGRCYGGVLLLSASGADLDLKNKDGEALLTYLKGTGIAYIIEQKQKRKIASIEESPQELEEN